MSATKAAARTAPRNLTEELFRPQEKTEPYALSDVEQRLIAIAKKLISDISHQVCLDDLSPADRAAWLAGAPPPPMTPEQFSRAHAIAFRCAVEIEKPLRDIRDKIEGQP